MEIPAQSESGANGFAAAFLERWRAPHVLGAVATVVALVLICHFRDLLEVYSRVSRQEIEGLPFQLWSLLVVGFVPFFTAALMASSRYFIPAMAGSLVVACALAFAPIVLQWVAVLFAVGAVGWCWFRATSQRHAVWTGALLLVLLALWCRSREILLTFFAARDLDPDSQGFLMIASESTGYATGAREPGFIWMVQLAKTMSGGDYSWPAGRLYGMLFSLLAFVMVFFFCKRWFGLIVATIACAFYALNFELSYEAVRLLREDSIIAAFFLFTWRWLLVWQRPLTARDAFVLGLSAVPLLLLRLNSLYFLIAAMALPYVYLFLKKELNPRQLWMPAVSVAVLLMAAAPYWIHSHTKLGNWQYLEGLQMRFYANLEFSGVRPDFPTPEEVEKEAYAGGAMKASYYLFHLHTPGELATGMLKGAERIFYEAFDKQAYTFLRDQQLYKPDLHWLHVLGVLAYFLSWKRFRLLVLLILFYAPSFFLAQFSYFDPRLVTVAFVGFYIGIGLAVGSALEWGMKFYREATGASVKSERGARETPSTQRKKRKKARN